MNRATFLVLTAIAVLFAGCGGPDGNTPANKTNTNTVKPAATADSLLALERQAIEAYFNGDVMFFEGMLRDNFVMLGPSGSRMDKTATMKMISGVRCDIKDGWTLGEPNVSAIDAETYILNYKGTFDGICTVDGNIEKASPIHAATVWVRSGDKWMTAFHGENQIVDLNAAASPPAHSGTAQATSAKDKKAVPDGMPSTPAGADPVTDALVTIERSVWEAWKATDAAKLKELTNKDLSFVDIFGNVTSTKADTIKLWSEHKCEVKSVSVTDGVRTSLSPTMSILTFRGNAEGTCYGQAMGGPIYGTSVYVVVP
ncbi:hypothetical protein BH20ACI2_BH20ACI2_11470 [soil metagenome]